MDIYNEIDRAAEALAPEIIGISRYVFTHPERGDTEYKSSAYIAEVLGQNGFTVEYPCCSLPTAFKAVSRTDSGKAFCAAFLAEYDALPGYGPDNGPAHACGHNWIAASAAGAGLVLAKTGALSDGVAAVIGTPAEETTGRKIDLLRAGAFDGVDAVFQMHLGRHTNLNVKMLAIDPWQFEFTGKASHAAQAPYNGINALDAVNLTFCGINALRQQLEPDVRVHGIVTDGGVAPNIIPAFASCRFYVRADDRKKLDAVSEKVKNCARGAALMTGTELKITQFENSFDDLVVNQTLCRMMRKNLRRAGIHDISDDLEISGSSDIGNVSHEIPVFYGNIGVGDGLTDVHEKRFLEYADSDEAHEKLMRTVKAFAYSAIELASDGNAVKQIKGEMHG